MSKKITTKYCLRAYTTNASDVYAEVFSLLRSGLYDALEYLDVSDVLGMLERKEAVLFVGFQDEVPVAVFLISFTKYPKQTVAELMAAAGKCFPFYPSWPVVKNWLLANDVHRMRCECRKAQARLFRKVSPMAASGREVLEVLF